MKKINYKAQIVAILKELGEKYPNQELSLHLNLCCSDYTSLSMLPDKELYYLLDKYRCEKELDINPLHDNELDAIIKDGLSLSLEQDEDDLY